MQHYSLLIGEMKEEIQTQDQHSTVGRVREKKERRSKEVKGEIGRESIYSV